MENNPVESNLKPLSETINNSNQLDSTGRYVGNTINIREVSRNDTHITIEAYHGPIEPISQEELICIVKEGILFDPAINHYKALYPNVVTNVFCDRCNKIVTVSIGLRFKDLCIDCAEAIKLKYNL